MSSGLTFWATVYKIAHNGPNLNVVFTAEPSAFVRPLEDAELKDFGLEAAFSCEVSKSDLKAEWFKADKPIKRSEKYNITAKNGQHSLTITDCQADDVASYTIKLDGISSTAKLAIKGNGGLQFQVLL